MKGSKPASGRRKATPARKSSAPSSGFQERMEAVYRLWDEMDRYLSSEEEGLHLFALGLRKLLKADNVTWMAAVRVLPAAVARQDPLRGWRLRATYALVPPPARYQKLIAWLHQRNNRLDPDFQIGLATHALVAGTGRFQAHRMRDGWIPFREFQRSEHYRLHYTELGISDRMWFSFPLNAHTESIFLVDRSRSQVRFSQRDAETGAAVLRGIRGFHRRLFLNRGLQIGQTPLSPVLQRIVQKSLTGMSEKEIALSMNQRLATTHKYIRALYKRFGVNGRAALMSLWTNT